MSKLDLKKELKHLYNPTAKTFSIVEVPPMNFLMIDGQGDPNTSQAYKDAVEALFSLSYTLKFMLKKGTSQLDYAVMPLEGLWWMPDNNHFQTETSREGWQWTSLIVQPEAVAHSLVEEALSVVTKKKNPPALEKIRFEQFAEGSAAQIMHHGPFAAEAPTIVRMHKFIEEQGFKLSGKHHEIYLSDFRRTAPDKLKTVVRQPFTR